MAELRKQREQVDARHAKTIRRVERELDQAKAGYDRALDRWRRA